MQAGIAAGAAILLLVVLAVLVPGGGGGPVRRTGTTGRAADAGPAPDSYSQVASSGAFTGIERRSADPAPLTERELFTGAAAALEAPATGTRLVLRARSLDQDCARAVWGDSVAAALDAAGCTQAARALYSAAARGTGGSGSAKGTGRKAGTGRAGTASRTPGGPAGGGYAAAVTIFNLADVAGADRFVALLDGASAGGFVLPPPTAPPLAGFGTGHGAARGLAMGHYAVVGWAERLGGGGDARDATLLSLLVQAGQPPAVLGRAAARG